MADRRLDPRLDADLLEPDVLDGRAATCRDEHQVGLGALAGVSLEVRAGETLRQFEMLLARAPVQVTLLEVADETGPLATSWHSNKFLNPVNDGVVLPILHLNGYKIANPTILGRMSDEELTGLFRGYGYEPIFVEGSDPEPMHQLMAETLDTIFSTDATTIDGDLVQRDEHRVLPHRQLAAVRERIGHDGASHRDADFASMSGVDVDPVYGTDRQHLLTSMWSDLLIERYLQTVPGGTAALRLSGKRRRFARGAEP